MFLNILAAVDSSPSSRRALEQAIDMARAMNSMLTLITVAPPLSSYVTLAGVSRETMRKELDKWAEGVLAEAAASVPDDLIVHTLLRTGNAGPEIASELERGHYDLVVLGSRGRGRAQEGLLGSVNGYLHFHSRLALLSVPVDTESHPEPEVGAKRVKNSQLQRRRRPRKSQTLERVCRRNRHDYQEAGRSKVDPEVVSSHD